MPLNVENDTERERRFQRERDRKRERNIGQRVTESDRE